MQLKPMHELNEDERKKRDEHRQQNFAPDEVAALELEDLKAALKSISDVLHGSLDNAMTAREIADKALAGWKGLRIPPKTK